MLHLLATEPVELAHLARCLDLALNRPGNPSVDVVAGADVLTFTADTWEPILRSRVEDALDDLVGRGWRDVFVRA
jgi:hypothetical protein